MRLGEISFPSTRHTTSPPSRWDTSLVHPRRTGRDRRSAVEHPSTNGTGSMQRDGRYGVQEYGSALANSPPIASASSITHPISSAVPITLWPTILSLSGTGGGSGGCQSSRRNAPVSSHSALLIGSRTGQAPQERTCPEFPCSDAELPLLLLPLRLLELGPLHPHDLDLHRHVMQLICLPLRGLRREDTKPKTISEMPGTGSSTLRCKGDIKTNRSRNGLSRSSSSRHHRPCEAGGSPS